MKNNLTKNSIVIKNSIKKGVSKKLRRIFKKELEKNFNNIYNAFSLVEIAISLLVISIIIACLTPSISKRLTATSSIKNRISTDCSSSFPNGFCGMCYTSSKECIVCTKPCTSSQYKNVSACECEDCSVKYNNKNCTRCNSKSCIQCSPGYYLDKNNNCTKCPKGYYCIQKGDGSTQPIACPKGSVAGSEGMSSCVQCLQSTSTQGGSVATSAAMTACVSCTSGSYAKSSGQGSSCEACPKGYYCPNGKYIPCPKGTANGSTGQTACTPCKQSTSSQIGSVATNTASVSCTNCGNGTYAKTSSQGSSCESCPLGHYCPSGKLIPCPAGTAQPKYGQTACISCTKSTSTTTGSVAVGTGNINCTLCGNGTYASSAGQKNNCTPCPKGFACPNGKISTCGIGTIAGGSASSCNPCPAGSTSPAQSDRCVTCANGCNACYGSATACTSCNKGYYKNGNNCTKCSAGYYCAGGTTGQQACAVGSISSAGSSTCTSCGGGKTSVNNTCQTCATGCTSCSGSINNCSVCSNGYYKSNSTCSSCPAGYYCKNNNKAICPENNYCPQNSSSPKACPAETTSPQGSKAETDCESEEWECKIEGVSSGGGTIVKPISPISSIPNSTIMAAAKISATLSGNFTWGGNGYKYGRICVMPESLRQQYLMHRAENPNLTWTPITESNVGSLCQDPTTQNFRFVVGGGCTGYSRTYANITSKSEDRIDYASSCKVTVLTCGRVDDVVDCDVYRSNPQPGSQKPVTSKVLFERSTFGTKNIKTIYSKEALSGVQTCTSNGSISYTYHYFYTSANSAYIYDYGCYCGSVFMYHAQQENEYFIVTKQGK